MPNHQRSRLLRLWRLFALHRDQAAPADIDATIRSAIQVGGTNLWILMFAIMIASVGLNVNSTAVIIGAMLISPLMGPIIGAGYGAGIRDFGLIRKALANLGIFVAISLLTSTLYFLISPLPEAQSELLARTSPNIWDVLIAFFGGAAGMVGLTRKEKTTVIPGVAIATALMPPLCTVSYGIATWQPEFFLGALYLFTINGVFIAFATLVITRVLRLPHRQFLDEKAQRHGRLVIGIIVTATLIPSIYLAVLMVGEQVFSSEASRYVAKIAAQEKELVIVAKEIDAKRRRIALTIIGTTVSAEVQQRLQARLGDFKLKQARLDLQVTTTTGNPDLISLKRQLEREGFQNTLQQLEQQRTRVAALESELGQVRSAEAQYGQLAAEIRAQHAELLNVVVAREVNVSAAGRPSIVLVLESQGGFNLGKSDQLERWLKVRIPDYDFRLVVVPARGKVSRP
jgi:uncharacterized hydrophobic protein (TIGR00271 family)